MRDGPLRSSSKRRQRGSLQKVSEEVKEVAWKAQHRLNGRYRRLLAKGKLKQQVVTAVGRELLGFIWAIGTQVEREQRSAKLTRRAA